VNRRLYRCRHDRKIAGVASGVAEFFELDPTLVRLVWLVSIFFGGFTLLLYLAMAIIVPSEPLTDDEAAQAAAAVSAPSGHRHIQRGGSGRWTTFLGWALVLFGGLALLDVALPGWNQSIRYFWPILILGLGAVLVAGGIRREPDRPANGEPSQE